MVKTEAAAVAAVMTAAAETTNFSSSVPQNIPGCPYGLETFHSAEFWQRGLITEPSSWTPWTKWSKCGTVCGGGLHYRKRECKLHSFNLETCDGHRMEAEYCNTHSCQNPANQIPWSLWSPCQPEGIRYRYKICTEQAKGKGLCAGNDIEMITCFLPGSEHDYMQSDPDVAFALIHLIAVGMIGLTLGAIIAGSILHHIHKCQVRQKMYTANRKNEKNEHMNKTPYLLSSSQVSLDYLNNGSANYARANNLQELNIKEIGTLKRNCDLRTNLALNDL